MKILFFLILLTYFITAESDYNVERVEGIGGNVGIVKFDSNGNAYVYTEGRNPQLFKLDASRNILWTINSPYYVQDIIINSRDEVYMNVVSIDEGDAAIGMFREDTLTIQEIVKNISASSVQPIFKDEEDNLFYNGLDGISLLKPDSTVPVLIENLSGYYNTFGKQTVAIDSAGNVYIGALYMGDDDSDNFVASIAVITKEEKQEEIPKATFIELTSNYLDYLTIDKNNDLWAFPSEQEISHVVKISNGNVEEIFSDDAYTVRFAQALQDRVYVIPRYLNQANSSAFYVTLDGDVRKVPGLEFVPSILFQYTTVLADQKGNVYLGFIDYWYNTPEILIVKPNDESIEIDLPGTQYVKSMIIDENNDLWLTTEQLGVYFIREGDTTPTEVPYAPGAYWFNGISVNKKTNEIFLLGNNGLYFINRDGKEQQIK